MRLLLDTQILVWMVNGDTRLRPDRIAAIASEDAALHVSAVVAFEYADLQVRGRIPVDEPIAELIERFDLTVEGFPAQCWQLTAQLPAIHRDPVDRMLIAHALAADMTLVTADANIRRYAVPVI
ncbi:MAG: type II toxin-antitoxin system VapC family toxin [Sphingomonadales bacterium]|nr:type II toxin-antitoxin system VapC family toxin [Sphingomonadales bacterium]